MFYDQQVEGTVACQLKWVGQTLGFVSLSAICLQQLALVWPKQQNMMNPTTKVSGQASFWWMNQFVWNWELQFICRMILTFKPSNIHVCLFLENSIRWFSLLISLLYLYYYLYSELYLLLYLYFYWLNNTLYLCCILICIFLWKTLCAEASAASYSSRRRYLMPTIC